MFEHLLERITERLSYASRVALFIIFAILTIDIVCTKVFGWSIVGAKAYVELLMVVVVFFTVPYVTASNGHINVDIIRYPKRVSHFLEIIHYLLGFLLAGFFTWRTFAFVIDSIQSHRIMLGTEGGITIPVWPLALVIVFGFAVMAFSYVVHFLNALGIFGKKDIAHTSQEA